MPTPLKTSENIRKHLTNAEKAARLRAEGSLSRGTRVQLRCPKWLNEDARKIFHETKRRVKGLELLDNADVELLGIYCDEVAKYIAASKHLADRDKDGILVATKDDREDCRSWGRLVAGYAEKLGLTPTARARLAKRKAEQEPPDDLEQLLDDVKDFVNGDGK